MAILLEPHIGLLCLLDFVRVVVLFVILVSTGGVWLMVTWGLGIK